MTDLTKTQQNRKSPGQLAYEADVKARPNYNDGAPRKSWDDLSAVIQWSWEKKPTPTRRKANTMHVRVYLIHDGHPELTGECPLTEAIPEPDDDQALAFQALRDRGAYLGGGGAAPLFLLVRIDHD